MKGNCFGGSCEAASGADVDMRESRNNGGSFYAANGCC